MRIDKVGGWWDELRLIWCVGDEMVYFAPSTTPYLPEKIIQQIEYIEGFATKQSNEEDMWVDLC